MKTPERKLLAVLDKYIPAAGDMAAGGAVLNSVLKNMEAPELLVPVLGLQGKGKSTLVNAILGEDIMPNEADETTCVPVEVRFGKADTAAVCFKDGKTENIALKELAQYVDNNYNPGNKKNAQRITLEKENALLEGGITFVDLPGVGSLTKENEETTKDYIKRLQFAIFVIGLNPPVTRMEAAFIKMAWQYLSNAWFAQNRWEGENEREVKEGTETNKSILTRIAEETGTKFSGEILTVHAHKALAGILQNKPEWVEDSNIMELRGKLLERSKNWKTEVKKEGLEKIKNLFSLAKSSISEEIEDYKLSKVELQKKLEAEEADFRTVTAEIEKEVAGIGELLDEHKLKASPFINKLVQEAEENIRSDIYRVIDGGVTDGKDLSRAFNDYQAQEFSAVNDKFQNFMQDMLRGRLSEKMSALNALLEKEAARNFSAASFTKRQSLKWEKGMEIAVRLGSGVGGILAGGAMGAAFGSVFPGIGNVIGFIAGIGLAIFGQFAAGKARNLVIQKRASETKREIAPVIEEVSENIRVELKKGFNDMCNDVVKQLQVLEDERKTQAKKEFDLKREILKNENNAEEKLAGLEGDLKYLSAEELNYVQ